MYITRCCVKSRKTHLIWRRVSRGKFLFVLRTNIIDLENYLMVIPKYVNPRFCTWNNDNDDGSKSFQEPGGSAWHHGSCARWRTMTHHIDLFLFLCFSLQFVFWEIIMTSVERKSLINMVKYTYLIKIIKLIKAFIYTYL